MNKERIHRAVSADGTGIAGRVYGEGPPMVFVHGAVADGESEWAALAPLLSDRFTCYLPSTRGRGLSGAEHVPGATVREISGNGHLGHLLYPERVAEELHEFFTTARQSAREARKAAGKSAGEEEGDVEAEKAGKGASGVRKEIEHLNAEFEDAFERGDFEGVAALYTEDALFLPPGEPVAEGRDAIRETFASYARAGIKRGRFDTLKVEDYGDTVLEMARSTVFGDSGALRQSYYVIVWKRRPDGSLQLHWDIVASSIG